jgi:hypothetical protein
MSAARSGTLVQRVVGKALRARNPGGDNGLPLQGREHGVEVKRTRSVGIHDEAEGAARYGGRRDLGSQTSTVAWSQGASIHRTAEKMPSRNLLRFTALRLAAES